MTDKELLEQLRTEVVAETPDCWSAILARVQAPAQQPEEEKVVPMPERGRRRGAWKRWVAAAAVFFLPSVFYDRRAKREESLTYTILRLF